MNKLLTGILIGLALGGTAVWFYRQQHPASAASEEKKEEKKDDKKEISFVQHGTNGETFLKLDKEAQLRVGVKTAPLAAAQAKPEVQGYGRVLDPAPLAALLVEAAAAKAALEASTREYERLKVLHAGQNASTRALETAEATMKRDQIQLDSVRPRLFLGWGKEIGSKTDLSAFLQTLTAREASLVRVDLPLNQSLKTPPSGGRLAPLTSPESLVEAQFLGPAPNADPQLQGQGFLFLQQTNSLPAGAAVVAWLSVPGEAESGVTVPREALIRHEGEVFVYVQTGDDTFVRKEIELERPMASGWFVHEGLKPQDPVVIVGAQQLLSEELKGQGAE